MLIPGRAYPVGEKLQAVQLGLQEVMQVGVLSLVRARLYGVDSMRYS